MKSLGGIFDPVELGQGFSGRLLRWSWIGMTAAAAADAVSRTAERIRRCGESEKEKVDE